MDALTIATYVCPICCAQRMDVPLLGLRDDDMNAWYLCFCRGDTAPGTRMTCPEDPRDPGPLFERKKLGRKKRKLRQFCEPEEAQSRADVLSSTLQPTPNNPGRTI